ncbi:hypothetical protein JFT60_10430 [Pseudomonas sp. MF6772]|uniref:hypothetical protein n=1 Tax=Pseudomonas sp. MF6772 TaxID=2797533 RepID=UPI0018E7B0D9|nr:hypothetical protein [Pseudomonas sp. MF6772]MBJ2267784.1 hypothetical protein [Pseudomonas sp. MF6772]
MNRIKKAVVDVGGTPTAAKTCGVSTRSVNKWIAAGRLPRTEYTGETSYAKKLAALSDSKFTAAWLLEGVNRNQVLLDGADSTEVGT